MSENTLNSKKAAAIVPAFNEEKTIAGVIEALKGSEFIDQVVVVDDGSKDRTFEIAQKAGVKAIRMPKNNGKGLALSFGVKETRAPFLIFVDADLKGLNPSHIQQIILPVFEDRVDMNIGVLDRGEMINAINLFFEAPFSGTRALKREVWEMIPQKVFPSKWEPERILKYAAKKHLLRTGAVILKGIEHLPKERKLGLWQGLWRRLLMIGRIILTMLWLLWLRLKP